MHARYAILYLGIQPHPLSPREDASAYVQFCTNMGKKVAMAATIGTLSARKDSRQIAYFAIPSGAYRYASCYVNVLCNYPCQTPPVLRHRRAPLCSLCSRLRTSTLGDACLLLGLAPRMRIATDAQDRGRTLNSRRAEQYLDWRKKLAWNLLPVTKRTVETKNKNK